jgi:serine phosphatase RsbU (regulator of sigma subunit)
MEWIFLPISSLFVQLTVLISGVGLVTVLMHLAIVRRNRKYHGDYHRLKEKEIESREVLHHRNLLQDRTKSYEQSLNYAQRIQRAMFITPKQLRLLFPESFIYQRPKDIVSGDFNWARRINGKVFFSVADCTGHGVPGAFMSLLGLEFFRQITAGRDVIDPATILNEMNEQFEIVFGDTEELALKDGMDLALCAYDHQNQVLEYAGAFNSVYIVRDHEILEMKGDRIIVGPDYGVQRGTFENRTMEIREDDILYMFTDGYADQFGGPEGKKFKYRRFRHLLMSIHQLPMEEQKRKLQENMNEWMGTQNDQIDDQTVLGIRPASFSSY